MMQENYYPVVLAGDYGYIRQIETTLKSLCYHNKHVKVYIFNQDIPLEWFIMVRKHLNQMGCELVDIKLLDEQLDKKWTAGFPHINYMAFARYFISEKLEEDRVLYLDSDIIVTADITHLFDLDVREYYGAAVKALHGMTGIFNSGVILVNNEKWKKDGIFDCLIETTIREWQSVPEGDQSILNIVFAGQWLQLSNTYNFPIGYDYGASLKREFGVFDLPIEPLPTILHYISPDKPWNTFSSGRLRQVWWDYCALEWSEIVTHIGENPIKQCKPKFSSFTVTNSQELEEIEALIHCLPDCQFHIAAYTAMGPALLQLGQYPNVVLHPKIMYQTVEQLSREVDIYFDINHGEAFKDVLEMAVKANTPIIGFSYMSHVLPDEAMILAEGPDEMVAEVKKQTAFKS
ncbi:glycosyltransferase family 8 protein [Streptococcus iniae]|nr:glycosyltransferase family 8 protein [Streptococcus iniae]